MKVKRFKSASESFKQFVTEKWYEHKYEILAWTHKAVDYDMGVYFRKNKSFLINEFKKLGGRK